jgi:hypothetical protein
MNKAKGYLDMELLRFTTAGSVDDGKSTLIGRLLYDRKAIFEDQMDILEETSKQRGEEGINLALFIVFYFRNILLFFCLPLQLQIFFYLFFSLVQ